jgi:hypothetical protein
VSVSVRTSLGAPRGLECFGVDGTGSVDGELEVPMRLGVQGQRQVDTPVPDHASYPGAAETEPAHEQSFDADRRGQLEADQYRERCRVVECIEGRAGLHRPGTAPVEAVSVLRGE